jgi:hypothetical protein
MFQQDLHRTRARRWLFSSYRRFPMLLGAILGPWFTTCHSDRPSQVTEERGNRHDEAGAEAKCQQRPPLRIVRYQPVIKLEFDACE